MQAFTSFSLAIILHIMNNNYKYLVWSGTAVMVILGIYLLTLTNHVSNTATNANTVSFSGEGKVLAKPDIALTTLTILTEATTSKAAQDNNSKKSEAVMDFLKKQEIDEKDIKTVSYNIYPQYSYPRPYSPTQSYMPPDYYSNPKITGYQVNETIEVKIRDLGKVSSILDGVVTAGVNQISGLQFDIDDKEKLKAEAREKAVADAKKKADELEDQVDIKLGKIINYTEGFNGWPAPMYYKAAEFDSAEMGGGGPDIATGQNEVVVNVTITYQIK